MSILEGYYFDGRRPVKVTARLEITGGEAVLEGGEVAERFSVSGLMVSPRVGRSERFVALPNGGQFVCSDDELLDGLPQEIRSEGPVAWLEKRWRFALAGVGVVVTVMLAAYFFGLPAVAKRVANSISMDTERTVGDETLAWMDANGWFSATSLAGERQANTKEIFKKLHHGLPMWSYYRLEFRSSEYLGPNALALPGGIVVITDEMVLIAATDEELAGVLAHEIGHVEHRHMVRNILQSSVIGVAVGAITSDAASLSVAVAGAPALLAQMKYSRGFEEEADAYAFGLLKERGYSPDGFATLIEEIDKNYEWSEGLLGYLSSHPETMERVKRAREAAKGD